MSAPNSAAHSAKTIRRTIRRWRRLARDLGVPNVELRASEKSAARGIVLTGLFPVPQYKPEDGYRIDASLLLAFARIESRFQNQATSPVGARGIMQLMPATARHLGGPEAAAKLSDPSYSLRIGPALYRGIARPNGRESI